MINTEAARNATKIECLSDCRPILADYRTTYHKTKKTMGGSYHCHQHILMIG